MKENNYILPTLERLVDFLLDCKQELERTNQLLQKQLEINHSLTSYLSKQTPSNQILSIQELQEECKQLQLLMADTKTAILEFIPTYYQAYILFVQGKRYFISKVKGRGNKEAAFILLQK
jgi:predicted transcriptional regulator